MSELKAKVRQEQLKSVIEGEKETLYLNLGIELESKPGEEGQWPALRDAITEAMGELKGMILFARKFNPKLQQVMVGMEDAEDEASGKPYKKSYMQAGETVPGFEWEEKEEGEETE